ncbi:unnamed protein product, partial [Mesorhabditis belari]|uniref:Protein kinase domain-containing protein n=1 Tax=Mesorhabditis belari TaxID=2138241 RepID=A0AAF3FHP9_9BILA
MFCYLPNRTMLDTNGRMNSERLNACFVAFVSKVVHGRCFQYSLPIDPHFLIKNAIFDTKKIDSLKRWWELSKEMRNRRNRRNRKNRRSRRIKKLSKKSDTLKRERAKRTSDPRKFWKDLLKKRKNFQKYVGKSYLHEGARFLTRVLTRVGSLFFFIFARIYDICFDDSSSPNDGFKKAETREETASDRGKSAVLLIRLANKPKTPVFAYVDSPHSGLYSHLNIHVPTGKVYKGRRRRNQIKELLLDDPHDYVELDCLKGSVIFGKIMISFNGYKKTERKELTVMQKFFHLSGVEKFAIGLEWLQLLGNFLWIFLWTPSDSNHPTMNSTYWFDWMISVVILPMMRWIWTYSVHLQVMRLGRTSYPVKLFLLNIRTKLEAKMPLFRKKKQQKGAKRVILKRDSISDDEDEVYVQARMSGKDLIFDLCNCQYDEHGKAELWTQIVYCLCINHKVTIVKRVFSEESLKEYRQLKDCTFSKFEDYALIGPRKLNREELNEFLGLQNKFNDFSTSSIWVNFEKGDKSFAKVDLFSKLFDPLMRGRKPDNDHDLPCIGVINDGDWLVWHKFTDCMQKIPFTINNAAAVTESELCEIYESDKPERLLEIFLGKSIESNDSGTSCSTKPMGNVSCSTSIDNFVDAASTWSSDLFNSNSSSLFRQESQPLTKHDFLSKIIMLEERNKLVGHGAYSEVYRISDSERPMAVKIFRASGNGRSAIKKLFENEVLTLKKLKHNFIIKYLDFVTMNLDMGYQFAIFMEFAEHGTLAQLIFSSKYSYSMYTVICWMEQLFDVLDYLEGNQILHRDIKPENIFLDQRYFLKLGDFGHAKIAPVVDESRAISESYAGTERYMSPECLFLAPQVTTGTDLYSLGIVLWEVIERRTPRSFLKDSILR